MTQEKGIKRNKGGAPKKKDSEKVVKGISIYFNSNELKELDNFISEKNLVTSKKSSLIKEILLQTIRNKDVVLRKNTDPKLFLELNKVGTNINQIAKKLNSLEKISGSDNDRYNNLLAQLETIMTRL